MSGFPKSAEDYTSDLPFEYNLKIFEESCLSSEEINQVSGDLNTRLRTGKWLKDEHHRFLAACEKYGSNWVEVNIYNIGSKGTKN